MSFESLLHKDRVSRIAPVLESTPLVVVPSEETISIPALLSVGHSKFLLLDLLSQLSSLVLLQCLWLVGGVVSLIRTITSRKYSRRITLISLLRATCSGVAEVSMSLGSDSTWFLRWAFSAIAGVLTASSTLTAEPSCTLLGLKTLSLTCSVLRWTEWSLHG